ncbi:MAG: acetolactate synthase 2 catalytic subunit, partial [Parcubacteria group bacterium CG11_big_fil_rev_8_21_14_0_20_39_22]
DDRVTGKVSGYLPHAKIIHIDIDPAELNKIVQVEVPIVADAKSALSALAKKVKKQNHEEWVQEFKKHDEIEKNKVWFDACHPKKGKIKMAETVCRISELTKGNAIIVADVGQHQMIAARYYSYNTQNSFHSS